MSEHSITDYFPFERVKLADHNVHSEQKATLVVLEPDQRFRPLCHVCGQPARAVHSQTRKFVRDLFMAEYKVTLQVEHRKIWCDHCGGVRVEKLDFVDACQRVTHRLARYAASLCARGWTVTEVADHLDLDPKTVKAIDKAALETDFAETDYTNLRRLAIDEIAVRKGHSYMTVVLDYDTGRVVWMGEGRHEAAVDEFFAQMPRYVRNSIVAVAIDMWPAYINCVQKWCPNADIVFDLFHVVKAFNKVIDKIRNEEFREADETDKPLLAGSKYLFLKNWGDLKAHQRIKLDDILEANERLNTVYYLKDFLVHIWRYRSPGWALGALAEWCSVARQDGHPELVKFARMLERHKYGIISRCDHKMHTSKLEGVNNKIKVIKRNAYGFHDLEYFAMKVKQAFPGV